MAEIIDNFEEIKFPRPHEVLIKKNPSDFVAELADLKHRLEYFKYPLDENSNDMREGYQQFMCDTEKYIQCMEELVLDIIEAMKYYREIEKHARAMCKVAKKYNKQADKYHNAMLDKGIDILNPLGTVQEIEKEVNAKVSELQRRKQNLDKVEEEIAITEGVLAKKKSEMELALQSRYTLTEKQKLTLLDEKDKILDGIEKWGSISGALSHDHSITSKASTIMMYCTKFPEFGEAISVSKQLFKDRLDGIMVERAIEGTENPVFGKGEYIGDYKIKDNKVLLELVKAKIPEEYNKKSIEVTKNQQINNMNIISFANIDETEQGYTRDVGVVLDVDETGKVKRITQEEKMVDFYSKKEGAEIILPDNKEKTDDK